MDAEGFIKRPLVADKLQIVFRRIQDVNSNDIAAAVFCRQLFHSDRNNQTLFLKENKDLKVICQVSRRRQFGIDQYAVIREIQYGPRAYFIPENKFHLYARRYFPGNCFSHNKRSPAESSLDDLR